MRTAGAFFIPILDRTAIAGALITAAVIKLAIILVVAEITTNRVGSTIPPVNDAPAPHFALTAKIAARNGLKHLSMGMSADFAIAIQFGATHVRVGSAIFGHR
jgi:uncharacterized pyridoxal phosphate-containing UPF0001 family protein